MAIEKPGSENGVVVATPAAGASASTGSQVLAERRQIDLAQACATLGRDMADMSSRPQITHGRGWAITLPSERRRKTVKVRPAQPAAQLLQHLRC